MCKKLIVSFLALCLFNDSAPAMFASGKREEEDTCETKKPRIRVSYGSSPSSAEKDSAGSGGSSPETVQCHFSLPVTDEVPPTPHLAYSWQFIVQVLVDPLEALFQAPTHHSADLLKTRLKGITLETGIDLLRTTKNKIDLITDISKIYALQTSFPDVLNTLVEKLDAAALLARLPFISQEVLDVRPGRLGSTLLGYVFFPKEFSDGYTSPATLFMNWPMHWKLAIAARAGYPAAQQALATILEENSPEVAQQLRTQAQAIDQAIIGDSSVPAYFKGLASVHLWELENDDREERKAEYLHQAQASFSTSLGELSGPSHCALAELVQISGNNAQSLEHYQKAAQAGVPRAYFWHAKLNPNAEEAFQNYKRAGELGIGEAYFEIAKMMNQGCVLPLAEGDPCTYEGWLTLAAQNGSMVAYSALAHLFQSQENTDKELGMYQQLAELGYADGFVEQGRIFENRGRFEEALRIYKEPNAGPYGLYEYIRKFGSNPPLLEEAETKNNAHYTNLITFLNSPR